MKKSILALALSLGMMPLAALAQTDTVSQPHPVLTDAQRQQLRQTFQSFAQQEMQLHQQLRSQIISTLTPMHRRAVAATIGELAIDPNPNVEAAAKRLDMTLSAMERERILQASNAFHTQSEQLHAQMRTAMQRIFQTDRPMRQHDEQKTDEHGPPDAGTVLLKVLSHPPDMDMDMHMHMDGDAMHGEGPPPQ